MICLVFLYNRELRGAFNSAEVQQVQNWNCVQQS